DGHARIRARGPAAQRVGRLGRVHFTLVEEVASAGVAEVDVAEGGAHAPAIADLPAITTRRAVAGLSAFVSFEEIEVAGAETAGGAAIGAADIAGHEPRTIADRQARAIAVANGVLGKRERREHRRNQRGRNCKLLHGDLLLSSACTGKRCTPA